MKSLILTLPFLVIALPAGAQEPLPYDGVIEYGVLEPDSVETYALPLAPGEEIIGIYAAPPIVQMPVNNGIVYDATPYTPPVEIDQVTGLPRNTPGWTGDTGGPAGIGCFPQGACAHLN